MSNKIEITPLPNDNVDDDDVDDDDDDELVEGVWEIEIMPWAN